MGQEFLLALKGVRDLEAAQLEGLWQRAGRHQAGVQAARPGTRDNIIDWCADRHFTMLKQMVASLA
jgi:hypothetical protein